MSEFSEGDLQRTLSSDAGRYRYPTNEGSSRLSSSSQSTQRQSENSRTSTTLDEDDEQSRVQPTHRVTAVVRPGQNVRIAYVPGQGVSSSRIDAASSGSETSSHYVQPNANTQTYRVYYKPVYTYQPSSNSYQATTNSESDRSSSTAHRINGVQKPEKLTNYDSFHDSSRGSQSRVQTEERDYDTQQRVSPAPVHEPANGGSSRYSSQSSQSGQTQNSSSRYAGSRPASGRVADSGDYRIKQPEQNFAKIIRVYSISDFQIFKPRRIKAQHITQRRRLHLKPGQTVSLKVNSDTLAHFRHTCRRNLRELIRA